MWERFPPRMRKSIAASLDEAGRAGRYEAAAVDLLLSIVRDGDTAGAYMLARAGLAAPRLVEVLANDNGTEPPRRRPWADRLSAEALHVLDVAADEARRRRHDYVGTEHVALALARLDHVGVCRTLRDLGFTYDKAEAALRDWLADGAARRRSMMPGDHQFSRRSARSPVGRWLIRPLKNAARAPVFAWRVFARKSIGHPKFVTDPYPLYRWLRDREPVRRDPLAPVWVVTRHADVMTVFRDARFKKDPFAPQRLPRLVREQLKVPQSENVRSSRESISMLFLDPPEHTRVRGLFARAFTPRSLEAMRPRIQQITDKWLDRVERRSSGSGGATGGRRMDLIADLAYPLPVTVIAEMLGFPPEDYEKIKQWSDALAGALGLNPTVEQQARSGMAREEIRAYFDRIRDELRQRPRDNLISRLLAVSDEASREEGQGLSPDELFANAVLLLAAGHETTTNLIGNGMLALLRNPDQLRALQNEPELMGSAVEELLRYDSPVQWTSRTAGEDMTLGGQHVRKDEIVLASVGAANRDERVFVDPDRLDLRRAENKHVAFGSGPHFCLGAALARMEGEAAIRTLITRFPNLRLERQKLQWHTGLTFRGVKALWLAV